MLQACGVNLTNYRLEELLTNKQIDEILKEYSKKPYLVKEWVLTKATEGLAGYLGDHLRLVITLDLSGTNKDIKLFIKCLPNYNQPKVEFLKNNLFYTREQFVINELLKNVGGFEGPEPWRPKVHICNEEIVVMPDLAVEGYVMRDKMLYYDFDHCCLSLTSLAKFHAASVNYETETTKQLHRDYKLSEEFSNILVELNFKDNAWMRAGAKTTVNFLDTFSKIFSSNGDYHSKIKENIEKAYIEACNSIESIENTFSVVIHKDLWSNNIMFKYVSGKPVSALILDFQCVRYSPPAFDVSSFLHLNTSRSFRGVYERIILEHYYKCFVKALTKDSVIRLKEYSLEKFLKIYEDSRMFGLLVPVMIFPYVLMDPMSAKKYFDNPDTYELYNNKDRTEPVIGHAKIDAVYRDKILEVSEEFVEKFILKSSLQIGQY